MSEITIAVLGGGNGALTAAGDLALAGFPVRMWTTSPEKLEEVEKTKTIGLQGAGREGSGKIDFVTRDIAEALEGAKVVCLPVPAFLQERIADLMGPHLQAGQIVLCTPGNFGTYLIARRLKEKGLWKEIILAETGTLPYLTRRVSPSEVMVAAVAVHLPTGVFPARKTDQIIPTLRQLYPAIHPVENALSAALMVSGPVLHPPLVVLNTGPLEHFPAWDVHNEGTTPLVKKMILLLDEERIAIRKKLGFTSHHYPFAHHYNPPPGVEWMYGKTGHAQLVKSEKWRERITYSHRYISEDVSCGLAFYASLGDYLGIETPLADAFLAIASAVNGVDYRREGRTMEYLGLRDKTIPEVTALLEKGW